MDRKVILLGLVAIALTVWALSKRALPDHIISGTIEQDETHLGARVGGRLAHLYIEEGATVTNGQAIAQLEAPEVLARRDLARARLAELEQGPRTQEVAAARSEWDALTAEYEFARQEAARAERLSKTQTLSDRERDAARAQADMMEKKVRAARDRYELLQAGTRPEQLAQARAQAGEAEALVAELLVRTPGDGVIDTLHAREGDVLPAHAPVATMVFQRPPWVRIYVPEPALPRLRLGAKLKVTVDSCPGCLFTAEIVQIAQKAEFTPRNVQTDAERVRQVFAVKLRFAADARLRPGMTAEIALPREP